jgi:hypothetical protein
MMSPSANDERCVALRMVLGRAVELLERVLLEPTVQNDLVAAAATRLAWSQLDDASSLDERTGAALDAFLRALTAIREASAGRLVDAEARP